MKKVLIFLFGIALVFKAFGNESSTQRTNETSAKNCFEKIKAAWVSNGKSADFFVGIGQITFDAAGKTKIYSGNGSVEVDGLSCQMNRGEKYPNAAIAYAMSGLTLGLSKGLTKGEGIRKFIFESKNAEAGVIAAAKACQSFGSDQLDETISRLNFSPASPTSESSTSAVTQ